MGEMSMICEMKKMAYEKGEKDCTDRRRVEHGDDHEKEGKDKEGMDDLQKEELCKAYHNMERAGRMLDMMEECDKDMEKCKKDMEENTEKKKAMEEEFDEEYLYMGKAMMC